MMLHRTLEHKFVRNAPRELEPGILYISLEYATAIHSCCCGCGERVITPLSPTDWKMTYDGETISLSPSVGNWNQRCQSHYIISRSRVLECRPWSVEEVESEQCRDKLAKAAYYKQLENCGNSVVSSYAESAMDSMNDTESKTRLSDFIVRVKSLFIH